MFPQTVCSHNESGNNSYVLVGYTVFYIACLAFKWFFFILVRYLLTDQNRMRSVNDIMPMIGARFYTQLDAAQMRNDVIEEDLAKVECS